MKIVLFKGEWKQKECKKMKKVIRELYNNGYRVDIIDVEEDKDIADRFNIIDVPEVIIFGYSNRPVFRLQGIVPYEKIEYYCDRFQDI